MRRDRTDLQGKRGKKKGRRKREPVPGIVEENRSALLDACAK